ncbi:MAG: phage portal protein [Candidatus Coproplasma sp.]
MDNWFRKPERVRTYNWEDILSGIAPVYSNGFGTNIYVSDVVQQAIYSIVTELKKLDPVHVRKTAGDNDYVSVAGNIQSVLDNPNPLMTTSDFIEKIAWTLLLNYNAFIYPIWNGDTLVALYPLNPSKVEFQQDKTGKLWIVFTFPNGYEGEAAYEDIIHLRYHYSVSEFMGGNEYGQPDFKPLLETLKLNDMLLKGLAKSLNLQTTINGVVKLKNMVNYDDQITKVKEFEKKLQANESGILPIDISAEYTPITKQVNLLDDKVLEFIDKKILRTFGVSIPIVNGDYTKEQYEAFYQKTIEPIVKSFNQAFTKGIFTKHAAQGFNNKIVFYVKELIFMNTEQKLNLFNTLGNIGGCYVNEMRTAFGMRPINDLQGVRMQSLNFVDSKYAEEYQTGNKSDNNPASNEGGA